MEAKDLEYVGKCIDKEELGYCFTGYSHFTEVNDPEFQRLRQNFADAAANLTDHLDEMNAKRGVLSKGGVIQDADYWDMFEDGGYIKEISAVFQMKTASLLIAVLNDCGASVLNYHVHFDKTSLKLRLEKPVEFYREFEKHRYFHKLQR